MKKTVTYSLADKEVNDLLENTLLEEDHQELKACNIRFAIIFVNTVNEDTGENYNSFSCLPYRVKIIGMKDRLLKNIDVEIQIDENYWEDCTDIMKDALLNAALHQIIECTDKTGMPVFHEDGVVKLKLNKPDIYYVGFSEIIQKYGSDSPDIKMWNRLKTDFSGILY